MASSPNEYAFEEALFQFYDFWAMSVKKYFLAIIQLI